MAIAIEGFTVVGLKARLEASFEGGLQALSERVPNSTELADDELWRCAFMVEADAQRFVEQLQQAGINTSSGPDSDIVLVSEFDLSVTPYCEWLELARWQKGVIAWLAGTEPKSVIAKEGWSPEAGSGLSYQSVQDENLEFVRLEEKMAVYFDKRLGQEVFVARLEADPDEVYIAAAKIVFDHAVQPGEPTLSGEARKKVAQAVSQLRELSRQHANAWRIHYVLGKGLLGLGELEDAYASLRRALELETEVESIPRELAGVCLLLGRADEAIQIGQRAAAIEPDNAEALGNLACAYLIGGRLEEASATIEAARKLNASDATNIALQKAIQRVRSGRLRQPRTLPELIGADSGSPPPPIEPPVLSEGSFWDKLQFWKRMK